jgi:transcriptional regulator with XRE-family HTH domain
MSQLDLALQADVSARHVSFIETGRAQPSREMLVRLSEVLEVPLRERNAVLEAAGYAQMYRETLLGEPDMLQVRKVLEFILEKFEPNGAVALDRHWNIVMANAASGKLMAYFLGEKAASLGPNIMRLMFHPEGLRPFVSNWDEVGPVLVDRVHREAVVGSDEDGTRKLLDELLSYPGVPARWAIPDLQRPLDLLIPVRLEKDDVALSFFNTITTLGTPQDITLQELRIECFFPMDDASEKTARRLLLSS